MQKRAPAWKKYTAASGGGGDYYISYDRGGGGLARGCLSKIYLIYIYRSPINIMELPSFLGWCDLAFFFWFLITVVIEALISAQKSGVERSSWKRLNLEKNTLVSAEKGREAVEKLGVGGRTRSRCRSDLAFLTDFLTTCLLDLQKNLYSFNFWPTLHFRSWVV